MQLGKSDHGVKRGLLRRHWNWLGVRAFVELGLELRARLLVLFGEFPSHRCRAVHVLIEGISICTSSAGCSHRAGQGQFVFVFDGFLFDGGNLLFDFVFGPRVGKLLDV